MRYASYDGLSAPTRHELGRDPLDGSLYVYLNRRGTQVKCLYFDRSGFYVWAKRLESGRFIRDWRQVSTMELDWTQLKLRWKGFEVRRVSKRYALPAVYAQSLWDWAALWRTRGDTLTHLVMNSPADSRDQQRSERIEPRGTLGAGAPAGPDDR
ncbi:MAG: IS66 family insertion sequence element accessory protein TnpB [Steroidobacteraceae bacterium]